MFSGMPKTRAGRKDVVSKLKQTNDRKANVISGMHWKEISSSWRHFRGKVERMLAKPTSFRN